MSLPPSLDLTGHVFVVAGAGGGIGREVSGLLAERGAGVICVDINARNCDDTVDRILEAGGSALPAVVDVRDLDAVSAAIDAGLSKWGTLTGLVNCVGITGETGINSEKVAIEDFREVVDVNLVGAFVLTRAVLPILRAAGYGRILHIASIAGKEGNVGMVSYSASKAGLIGMVKSLGKEYATEGITVNALAPAVIWTPMVEAMPERQVEYMSQRIPMGRLGLLSEVAELAAWIVSPAASFTTGFTFDLSGGRATY